MTSAPAAPLAQRIKAEFDSRSQRQQDMKQQREKEAQDREARLAHFTEVCEDLKSIWRPRIEEFSKQFGEKIKVTPVVNPSMREAKVAFLTDMANITLTLSASANNDVT